ncbi:N-acetylmuramoyl-L-alanine amidase [Pararhodobacter sp. CCB-MM2]|uniref:N-acetylmuramoyl-L-alanine amidase family protein n=1 Tax=Pararhodobacter sp. CCB-MM2 TaxID=1786003 RepID=UPI000B203A9D|nr:N-acetylmuramoyl-L-alanine amidase [Pararhodobacter sp. CCB-MM2]MCA2010925.1 N-acetylmuramoyl-L-alanine amidase [Cereibacter sphaeroides]
MRRNGAPAMTGIGAVLIAVLLAMLAPLAASAQELGGMARLAGPVTLEAGWRSLSVSVPLNQAVPWRTRLLADPPRAVVDFRTLDWGDMDPATVPLQGAATALRVGNAGGGWTRLVIELDRPMGFSQAGMATNPETGAAQLTLSLSPLTDAAFAEQATALAATDGVPGEGVLHGGATRLPLGQRPTRVVLDPGHGGVDPGATHEELREADITLTFARELAETLHRTGRYEVVLTREDDSFLSLENRITVAHEANADLFLSIHTDSLEDGQAVGATLYTLAAAASDAASAALAERHDRDDLMGGGVDLSGTDDAVATVLMDLARAETRPATDRLARTLVAAIDGAELRMHRHPWQQAAFSVLKSPSVPSALLELGFLSSEQDRARLRDRRWRVQMERAVVAGIDAWVEAEAAQQALRLR